MDLGVHTSIRQAARCDGRDRARSLTVIANSVVCTYTEQYIFSLTKDNL